MIKEPVPTLIERLGNTVKELPASHFCEVIEPSLGFDRVVALSVQCGIWWRFG
jgi:hypothetical protein